MNQMDRKLMRHLHGELAPGEVREIERRLAEDAQLAERYRRLQTSWNALELPTSQVGSDFAAAVMQRARRAPRSSQRVFDLQPMSVAMRTAAAAALLCGTLIGASLELPTLIDTGAERATGGHIASVAEAADSEGVEIETFSESLDSLSLAESYWLSLSEADIDELFVDGATASGDSVS